MEKQAYVMCLGETVNLETQQKEPLYKIIINEDQFRLIEQLANVKIDADCNKNYVINALEFKIIPYFKQNDSPKQ